MAKLAIITPLLREGSTRRYLYRVHLVDGDSIETRHYRGQNGGLMPSFIERQLPEGYSPNYAPTLSITPNEWRALLAEIRSAA